MECVADFDLRIQSTGDFMMLKKRRHQKKQPWHQATPHLYIISRICALFTNISYDPQSGKMRKQSPQTKPYPTWHLFFFDNLRVNQSYRAFQIVAANENESLFWKKLFQRGVLKKLIAQPAMLKNGDHSNIKT